MIRWLSIMIARFRYRAIAAELAAVERQLAQQVAYRDYLLAAEARAAVALLIAEGGDVGQALKVEALQGRKFEAVARRAAR